MTVCLQQLLKHIDNCPFVSSNGLHEGKILVHKNTTQEDILKWLKKLAELNKYVKEQEMKVLDITSRNRTIARTL